MLVQFFKNNNPTSYIFLSLLSIVLWVNGFAFHQNTQIQEPLPFFELFNKLPFYYTFIKPILALLFVLGEAFLLNLIANKYDILPKSTYLPALLYIILMSMDNSMFTLHSTTVANFLILLVVYIFMESYRKDAAFSNAFDVGALTSIATLFYFPSIVLLPVLGIGLLIMRPFIWREWVICLIGICVPYLFVLSYYFCTDQITDLEGVNFFYSNSISPVKFSSSLITVFFIVLLIVLLSIGKTINNLKGGAQKKSKSTLLFIWIAVFSLPSLYLSPSLSCKAFSLLIIPASIFCSIYLSSVKKKWWGEFLFSILFISIMVNLMSVYF